MKRSSHGKDKVFTYWQAGWEKRYFTSMFLLNRERNVFIYTNKNKDNQAIKKAVFKIVSHACVPTAHEFHDRDKKLMCLFISPSRKIDDEIYIKMGTPFLFGSLYVK